MAIKLENNVEVLLNNAAIYSKILSVAVSGKKDRGVAKLVSRVVWDHEAQSSSLCTPTSEFAIEKL